MTTGLYVFGECIQRLQMLFQQNKETSHLGKQCALLLEIISCN